MLETVIILVAWCAWAAFANVLLRNPREDVPTGLLYTLIRIYALLFQRARGFGLEHVPASRRPGPLVVVANHTAGIDPVMVQAFLPFEPRWMMGRDMMTPNLRFLWEFTRVIAVDRDGSDSTSAREALRELRRAGVLGIFPEGGIERPSRVLRPFLPGIGTIIVRSGAPVLPVFIDGTPDVPTAMGSITRRGRVRVRFGPVMNFAGASPKECVERLQSWFESVSGWPTARLNLWEDPTAPRE